MAGRYAYLHDLRKLEECTDPACPVQWPTCPSPVHLNHWMEFLYSHPDQEFAAYIHTGLSQGFRIGYNRQISSLRSTSRNHPSALSNPQVVQDHIAAEVEVGRLLGPMKQALLPLLHSSPIGLVPKSNQVDRWRMIVDLSFPPGGSVNDGVARELASLTYAKVDDAIQHILQLGVAAKLVKIDLKNAYRIVPIHPQDHHLLAITWEGETYIDRALPFGLRSAPKIFSAVADMIAWALQCAGIEHQIHYLDDFLFIGAPNTDEGARALAIALRILEYLGVPVAVHKTEGPSTAVIFLGILIDTEAFMLRLPAEKLARLQELVLSWISKRACTKKELESLLGHLSHAASVVRPGRTFLRELFSLLHLAKAPHHYLRLSAGAKADLAWWGCFLRNWNGSSFFPLPTPATHVYSDASGTFGSGAFVSQLGWLQASWPRDWEEVEISAKELVPVVMAAALWGQHWTGQHVRFHSDNMAVVAVLGTRTARTPLLMHLLRCFSFFAAYHSFHFSARHIPGELNTAADALSRNNMSLFFSLVPQTPQCTIPTSLFSLLVATRPDWGSPTWTQLFATSLTEVLQRQQ